jgi:hypothetical protein
MGTRFAENGAECGGNRLRAESAGSIMGPVRIIQPVEMKSPGHNDRGILTCE